jgi:hypothetical protein
MGAAGIEANGIGHRNLFDFLFSPQQRYGDQRLELVGDKAG